MRLSQLYSYSVIIALWCTLLTMFLSSSMPKRDHFIWRVIGSLIAVYFGVIFTSMIPFAFGSFINVAVRFIFVVLFCALACFACYKISFISAIFLTFAGYTIRHMVYLVCQIFCFILKDTIEGIDLSFYMTNYLFTFAFYIFFIPLLLSLHRLIQNYQGLIILPPMMTLFVSGVAILTDVIFNNLSMFYLNNLNLTVKYWMNCINIILCIMTLVIMFGYAKQVKIQSQVAVMNQLEYQRNIQLDQSRKTMEIINIKCHDLRHQIRELENISDLKIQKELSEIEKQLRIYDTKVKTGNEPLDVILSEKSLICRKNKISLDCIIDGKRIDFLTSGEISSLFGNIIDNAMESLDKIENEKMRIITLKVNAALGGALIIAENPYCGNIKVVKGKIMTTKADEQYHGFGLKSIQNIVDRHGGVMKITTDNSIFRLKIFFPKN